MRPGSPDLARGLSPGRRWDGPGPVPTGDGQQNALLRCADVFDQAVQVTFDCAEPERLAQLNCRCSGTSYRRRRGFATWDDFDRSRPREERGSWFACGDPSGAEPATVLPARSRGRSSRTGCISTCGSAPGSWSEEHLAALEAECARLIPLGAVRGRLLYDGNDSCIVMQDIEATSSVSTEPPTRIRGLGSDPPDRIARADRGAPSRSGAREHPSAAFVPVQGDGVDEEPAFVAGETLV